MTNANISQRRKCRLLSAQFLYSWSLNPTDDIIDFEERIDDFISTYGDGDLNEKSIEFTREICAGTVNALDAIDDLIEKNSDNWKIDRISKVDLAILRECIYEMLFRDDIPPIVSMNEAIEVGKMISSDESQRFLNGVLDNIKNTLNRPLRNPNWM